jgi:hypothetical protein
MKRVGGLWSRLVSWENLEEAARRAAVGKRSRPDVAVFLMDRENELVRLRRALAAGEYVPGRYREFTIREPKPRLISAAPFRDRVVHHALTQVLEPVFEPRFAPVSFACRRGLGTHAALRYVQQAATRCSYALKADFRKYFANIDHEILLEELRRGIKCERTLQLAATIVAGSNTQEAADWYFPGDHLFTPSLLRRGLPLGNQTSQFFANVYLNRFDHFVLRQLRPGAYARYVDDVILLGDCRRRLEDALAALQLRAQPMRLLLHERKSRVYRVADGIGWLGWRVFPDHARLQRPSVVRAGRRLRALKARLASGDVTLAVATQSIQGWVGHARNGDTWRLREAMLGAVSFIAAAPGPLAQNPQGLC